MSNGPFAVGQRYRVLKDFKSLRDAFLAGEVLIYESTAWSRYDGITGYFFKDLGGRGRMWDIYDDEDIGIWKELFNPISQ